MFNSLLQTCYDTLINGNYKLLIEPIAYFTFQGHKFAMTATEAAIYDQKLGGGLRSKMVHDIDRFCSLLYSILKPGGRLILSDFHPFRKIIAAGIPGKNAVVTGGNYFDSNIHNGDVAYKDYFPQQDQVDFPDCSLRFYTLSEILNAVIHAGFNIREFNEHPNWDDTKIPGEFTIYALK